MSYAKPSNLPPIRASGKDMDPDLLKERTYMRGIYEDYHAHRLEFENGKKVTEESIASNFGTVQQEVVAGKPIDEGEGDIDVLHEGDVGVLDGEQLKPAAPLGLVAGEIVRELGGEGQKKVEQLENVEDAALQADDTEDIPEDDGPGELADSIYKPQLAEEQPVEKQAADKAETEAGQSAKVLGPLPTETSEIRTPPSDTSLDKVPTDEILTTESRITKASATQHTVLGTPPIEGPTGTQEMGLHPGRMPAPENLFKISEATRPITRFGDLLPIEPNPRPVSPPIQKDGTPIQEMGPRTVVQTEKLGNEVAGESASNANFPVGMSYPELAAASALCDLKALGEESYRDSKAGTEADPSVNAQYVTIEEPPSTDTQTQRSTSKGTKAARGTENIEDIISKEGISNGGSASLEMEEGREGERELTIDLAEETKSKDDESTQKTNETYQELNIKDHEASAGKGGTKCEKGEGGKSHTLATAPTEKYSDSLAESSSEDQLTTPTTDEERQMGRQSTNFSNSHSAQTSQSGESVQSATPTNGVGSRPSNVQLVNLVDGKQHVQNGQHADELEELPDNELRELVGKLGLYWRQDQVSGLTREQLISMLKAAHEAGGASWAQFWRALSLLHTSRLPNNHVLVRLSQWFSTPLLEFPVGDHGIVQGQTSRPKYKGIPISVVESQRPGRAINYYNHACLIIDPCTMKSVGDWKLVMMTQTYNARIKAVGSEPRNITEDALLDRDERKLVHFATTEDLSNGLITRVPKSGPPEVVWDEKQESRLGYLGDFPFQAYWGGPSYHQRITLGMIPIVEDIFPQHIPAPLASGSEIRLVLGQDFIEHKQYYKYVVERETQDLIIDWDFQVYRNPNVNVNRGQQTMKCFVDGFYRDGAEWAAMYHVTGSWFNGIVLLTTDSSNTDKPVFITLKALWKALMQVQELMMRLVGFKPLPLRLIMYVLQRDVAAAFENNWAMIKRWESKGWTKADGHPVVNRDLWEQLLSAIRQLKTLLNIEVSIQYDAADLDPRELQKYNLGIKCLKTLKQNVPSYVNLRRPDIADYFLKATIKSNAMGIDVKGINYRGSQCDILLPEKLRELAYSLQNEGCMKCNSVHKIYLPMEQGRGARKEDVCPLLSQLPDPIISESSVSRETIAMYDLLGPYDELNPTRPFGHQLCLCNPDSQATKEALAILCNTHVIVYGHHNWIAMDKKELMLSLAEADEVGLPGDLEIYGSDKWINHLKSKPGGAEAFEEYKKNSKKTDSGKKAINRRMKKKAKANKGLGTGQTEERPDAEKEEKELSTDGMLTTVLNGERTRVQKGHEGQVIEEDQAVHKGDVINGLIMEGQSGVMEGGMEMIRGGEPKGEEELQPVQVTGGNIVDMDGLRGEDSERGDNNASRTAEFPKGSKNQQRKEKEARKVVGKGKRGEKAPDGGATVSCGLDDNFEVEEMEKDSQKHKELATNDWRTTEADAGDAEDEASDEASDEVVANKSTGVLQFGDEDDLHSQVRVVPVNTAANNSDNSSSTLASDNISGISDLELNPEVCAETRVEGGAQTDDMGGVGECVPSLLLHDANQGSDKNQWKPEGRSWADDEDDSEAERAFWEQLYADTRKFLPNEVQAQSALQPRDPTANGRENDVTKLSEAGSSRLRNPWRRNVDIGYADETPRTQVPIATTQREIEEAAREMALKGTFPTSRKTSGMVTLGYKNRSRTATKAEEGKHDDEGGLESKPAAQVALQKRPKAEQKKMNEGNLTTIKTAWGIPELARVAEGSTASGGLKLGKFPTLGSAVGKGVGKGKEVGGPINKNVEMKSDYGRERLTFGGFAKTLPQSKMEEEGMEKKEVYRRGGGSTQGGRILVNTAQRAEAQ